MGIWTDAFLAPAEPRLSPVDSFGRLLVDLGRDRIVRMPWTLIAGQFDVNTTLLWSGGVIAEVAGRVQGLPVGTLLRSGADDWVTDAPRSEPAPWGCPAEHGRVLASGDAVLDVLPALAQAPYGNLDIAVVFESLDFDNPALLRHFWRADHRTAVVCYALARPQPRVRHADTLTGSPGGPTHDVQVCLVYTFKQGDQEACPAIDAVVRRHLGPGLIHGRTWH